MTLVFEAHRPAGDVAAPSTHAVVIGTGTYPYSSTLGDLTSPPRSARAIADWLVQSFRNPAQPLASVRLLLSEPDAALYTPPPVEDAEIRAERGLGVLLEDDDAEVAPIPVEVSTSNAVDAAIRAWLDDGNRHPDSLLLFFFCGHGIAGGASDLALLNADFARDAHNPLDGALDLRRLRLGVNARCKARRVCYFIDACRTQARLSADAAGYVGRVPVLPGLPQSGRSRTTFYSTVEGAKAFGRPRRPSYFTEALLRGLRGAGAEQGQGSWQISTSQLGRAIDDAMRLHQELGLATAQIPSAEFLTTFPLHHLQAEPEGWVVVRCEPRDATPLATLTCRSDSQPTNVTEARSPSADGAFWELALPIDRYRFDADFDAEPYTPGCIQGIWAFPPLVRVNIPVEEKS